MVAFSNRSKIGARDSHLKSPPASPCAGGPDHADCTAPVSDTGRSRTTSAAHQGGLSEEIGLMADDPGPAVGSDADPGVVAPGRAEQVVAGARFPDQGE